MTRGGVLRGRVPEPHGRPWPGEQRGSTTVIALVLVGLLTSVALAGAVAGGVLVGKRRAAAAADLAALAAAETLGPGGPASVGLSSGEGAACAQAALVSRANAARLTTCRVEAPEVFVQVAVDVRSPWGSTWPVPGSARAGPVGGR